MNSSTADFSPASDFIQLIRSNLIVNSNIVTRRYANRKANVVAHNLAHMDTMSLARYLLFKDISSQPIPIVISDVS